MIPERTIFADRANYGVPLAARLSDSMPSVCSFDVPSIGAATLDSTAGLARRAIPRALLRTALCSLAVLIFGQRRSVSRCCGTSLRCKLNRRWNVRGSSDRSSVESLRSAEVLGQVRCAVQPRSVGLAVQRQYRLDIQGALASPRSEGSQSPEYAIGTANR